MNHQQPNTEWRQRTAEASEAEALQRALGISRPMATVMAARGIVDVDTAHRYLEPGLRELPDPARLAGLAGAVERIVGAVESGETIGIFGDYDVDGTTSASLLWDFLEAVGGDVVVTVPDRLTEGYGLSSVGVARLRDAGATLIITVDCGISSHAEIDDAVKNGLDVIVVDHHTVPDELPRAVAVVNPHRADCRGEAHHLCAVGVTFNLCMALRSAFRARGRFKNSAEPDLRHGLDLVALGTVADVVPLVDDNRVFVHWGLRAIRRGLRPGMQALLDVADIELDRVTSGHLGFQLGPRINAAGRLGDAMKAVRLLRTRRLSEARSLASALDSENASRRDLEKAIFAAAAEQVTSTTALRDARCLVVGDDDWHPGVVGIVASRLVERFGKPTIVIGNDGRGSGRSIPKYHLLDGLHAAASLLDGFGGHAHAAGVKLSMARLDAFRDAMAAHAASKLDDKDLGRLHQYDCELSVDEVGFPLCADLTRTAPFGRGNPEPVFRFDDVMLRNARELRGGHLKARVDGPRPIDVIYFGGAERFEQAEGSVDFLATPEINRFRGQETLQLRVRDLRRREAS